ncbi:NADPH-dependent F420 reductase [Pseudoduganella sp. OTU4001]|uniref:NADPH-dependent F420 reductase n=1 Tax=Pseudoduganella sp. OTU4001 TaxID=3043854 RepID=UPI00313B6537
MNTISIIGAGSIGSAIARLLTGAGLEVKIANSRGPSSLAGLVAELGPRASAATAAEAARADIVFLSVPWSRIASAVEGLGDWGGRIVVDTNNPIEAPAFKPFDLGGRASSEVVAGLLPGARVVKAFNHLPPALLAQADGGQRVLFFSGEDAGAKQDVAQLIERLGLFGIDLGGVEGGKLAQFPGGPLPALNLLKV